MAIAADTAFYGGFASATSLTFSYTVTGSNTLLLVGVQGDTATDPITGVTYNSAAMTLIAKIHHVGTGRWIYLYRLVIASPDGASHNVVISSSSSIFIQGFGESYSGVDQTNPIDSFNTGDSGPGVTTYTASTTVVGSGCWLASFFNLFSGSAGPLTAGTGSTRRANDTNFTSSAIFDSNGTVGTGSQSMQANWSGGDSGSAVICSIAPVAAGGGLPIPVAQAYYRQKRDYSKKNGIWTPDTKIKTYCFLSDNLKKAA